MGRSYELDLVLRNNRTTEEHPLGLFHPHAQYHHIKKENIGLIEVMGLAILPPRLLTETKLLEQALQNPAQAEEILARPEMEKHRAWYEELKAAGAGEGDTQRMIQESIGTIFGKILGNAGVYKDTQQGREAFRRFCQFPVNVIPGPLLARSGRCACFSQPDAFAAAKRSGRSGFSARSVRPAPCLQETLLREFPMPQAPGGALLVAAPLPYEEGFRETLHRLKFWEEWGISTPLGQLMGEAARSLPGKFTLVTCVPMSSQKASQERV